MITRSSGLVVPEHIDATARPAIDLSSIVEGSFFRKAPEDWERRLREVSPIRTDLAHLRFRVRASHESWLYPKDEVWMLYAWTPKHMVDAERAEQFRRHWTELPKAEQPGRQHFVSDYQFWVWHEFGYEARPFWILQGNGGTPAKLTDREKRYLDASDLMSDPFPIGAFPPCRFDERAVRLIQERDRLIQAGNRMDALRDMDSPDAQKAEEAAAELVFRETFLDTWREIMAPSVEFMKSYLKKSEADHVLPKASRETANAVDQWRDQFKENGSVIGASAAPSKRAYITVK